MVFAEAARIFKARPVPRYLREARYSFVGAPNPHAAAVKEVASAITPRGSGEGPGDLSSRHSDDFSMSQAGSGVEGTMLERQREWEEARARKLNEARILKEEIDLAVSV